MESMNFDIEADWTLNLLCNYNCRYCFSRSSREHRLVGRLSPDEYADFFDSTGKTWLLHLTGGEPFIHRDFIRLCRALTARHYISVNSNLSSPRVPEFAAAVDPSRVSYLHCGVHVEERDRKNGWKRLAGNLSALRERGFPLFASLVMTPDTLAHFERTAQLFAEIDIPLIPKALRGWYRGRWYPQAYTGAERDQFRHLSGRIREMAWFSRRLPFRNNPTVNPLIDAEYLDGFPEFGGMLCAAGRLMVSIGYDGRVFRCGERTLLGNIFERRLTLFSEDRPCDDHYCPYWCLRYSRFRDLESADYPRRGAPNGFEQSLVLLRVVQREIGNRITDLVQTARS